MIAFHGYRNMTFDSSAEAKKYLKKERDYWLSFWKGKNEEEIRDKNAFFAPKIRNAIRDKYNILIEKAHKYSEWELKLSQIAILNDEKDDFSKSIRAIYDKTRYKLVIYILGLKLEIINASNESEWELEVLDLARMEYAKIVPIAPFRVLAITGGGMMGYYEAKVLEYFVEKEQMKRSQNNSEVTESTHLDIGSLFDMICGTSTGSLLSASLADRTKSISTIVQSYKEYGKKIFSDPIPKKRLLWSLRHLAKPSSSQDELYQLLDDFFENKTLNDIWKESGIALCIPSVDIDTNRDIVFMTPHSDDGLEYANMKVKDVCMASSAAPIYFPLYKSKSNGKTNTYVDGGLWANNPILIGLSEAIKMSKKNQPIEIYSLMPPDIGDVDPKFTENIQKGLWGWQAGVKIVDVSLSSQVTGYTHIAKKLSEVLTEKHPEQNIKIFEFPRIALKKQQFPHIGLDRADEMSFNTIDNLIKQIESNFDDLFCDMEINTDLI